MNDFKPFTLTITNRNGKPVAERYLRITEVRSILNLMDRKQKERERTKELRSK